MKTLLYVFIGGGLGAFARYELSQRLNGYELHASLNQIPLGTLLANLIGSLLLGFLVGALPQTPLKTGLTTGLMGGLTTFSTLSVESANLIEGGLTLRAALHISLHVGGGVILAIVGLSLGALFVKRD